MSKKIGKRAVSVVAATGLALSLTPVSAAWADSISTDGYVTAAVTRAASPAPEILGLSSVEESGQFVNLDSPLDWSQPKFWLNATTEYNTNPNPYQYNFVYDRDGASSQTVINEARNGQGGGPSGSLAAYGVDETDDAVWDMLPDVVIGNAGTIDYDTDPAYGPAVSAALGVDYHPESVAYSSTDNSVIIDVMYDIAQAGDEAATRTGKQLRYGDATDIARQYEAYVRGTQGYVLQQLEANGAQKKTVACIGGYDAGSGTYTLLTSGVQEGTAATNRLLEAAEIVANNLVDTLGTETVTVDQLAQADVILVGGQNDVTPEDVVPNLPSELQQKCYYVTENGSNGSMYGVTMNSVENAQNIGRVIGFIYPEYVDQDDWMCYYYDNFYHIKSDMLAQAIDNAMDGVRNYDAAGSDLTSWTAADAATYNEASVQARIDAGMAYIEANESTVPAALVPSDEWSGTSSETPDFSDVPETDWYAGAVSWAAENGVMNGYGNGLFGPTDSITRAQAATVLYNYYGGSADGSVNQTGMADVAIDWYTAAANWAVENGVVNGVPNGDGTYSFDPNGLITRDQLCTMVANAAEILEGATIEGSDHTALEAMPDAASVPDWAKDSVAWCLNAGVVNGVDENGVRYVRPSNVVDRATMAMVMMNAEEAGVITR